MTNNVIYAYKKRSTGKIVYVGQTVNLTERDKQHMRYDPFNINNKEYNYPLSRGVRKIRIGWIWINNSLEKCFKRKPQRERKILDPIL